MYPSLPCQICGRDVTSHDMGTNADGSPQPAFCIACFRGGMVVVPKWLPIWVWKIVGRYKLKKAGASAEDIKRFETRIATLSWWEAKRRRMM